jgi:hypothetical protein
MIGLEEALRAEAASVLPVRDLDDVYRRVRRRKRSALVTRCGLAVTVAAGVALGVGAVSRREPSTHVFAGGHESPPLPGIEIGGAKLGGTLERSDPQAASGPWTVVVRTADGSLGHHSAVVSYPVDARARSSSPTEVVWPLGAGFARVRGDLGQAALGAIVRATSVVAGHPRVDAPAGLHVVSTGPYWPVVLREARYGSVDVREAAALGNGLTYADITAAAGGIEDQLLAGGGQAGSIVGGHPAVLDPLGGGPVLPGNANLVWEPSPGVVAFVGYSGASFSPQAGAALQRIARRTWLPGAPAWQATHPQIVPSPLPPGP